MSSRRRPTSSPKPWRPRTASARRRAAVVSALVISTAAAFIAGRAAATAGGPTPLTAAVPEVMSPAAGAAITEGSRVIDGVPLGYTDDEVGAVAAATAFARVLSGPLALTPEAYRLAVQTMAAPNARDQLTRAAEQQTNFLDSNAQLPTLATQGIPVTLRCVPLSHQVDSFTALASSVSVWSLTLMAADGHMEPRALWATVRYQLLWIGTDWRLERSLLVDAGWAPVNVQPSPPTTDTPAQLRLYQGYGDA